MEIELRANVNDPAALRDALAIQAEHKGTSNEHDFYLRHKSDKDRSLILRIRRKESGSLLTFKGKALGDDTAWPDIDIPLTDADSLQQLLLGSGYVKVVEIKKRRASYRLEDFEINVDEIENLGVFVELEGRGDEESRKKIEEKIMNLLVSLGIQNENIIRKGYVALMLELEQFSI